ncbi:hypothetical protein AN963_14655 [Brevibacillus choshinensis]|uniref:Uncharacterized protein n=1 Tax=Brevibacillus choshinensis TaxID=54911 RepID=A0ABR5N6E1_BRECH|nr:hypothetical protein AN963_14655 [Brevibacillus choshinensis]
MNRFEPTLEHPGMTWTGFFHLLSKKESRTSPWLEYASCLRRQIRWYRGGHMPFRPYQRDERAFFTFRKFNFTDAIKDESISAAKFSNIVWNQEERR